MVCNLVYAGVIPWIVLLVLPDYCWELIYCCLLVVSCFFWAFVRMEDPTVDRTFTEVFVGAIAYLLLISLSVEIEFCECTILSKVL